MVGAHGWVGGVVNVLPASHVQLYRLAGEKCDYDAARQLFFQMLPTLELMEGRGKYTQFVKAGCRLLGHDAGPPRRPLQPASEEECRLLEKVLHGLV
jgi:4-hydroxy-tetrahydrodipicolinate synthase